MNRPRHHFHRNRGAALVVMLIVMVVLAMVAVAFMQNTGLDRSGARSSVNAYRAKLAAESGLAEAMASLSAASANDDFIVLKTLAEVGGGSFPAFYVGEPQKDADVVNYIALFSGGRRQDGVAPDAMPAAANVFREGIVIDDSLQVPAHLTGAAEGAPKAGWVELRDEAGVLTARYAYWVEDLGGYLDAELAGAKPLQRTNGLAPAELGMFTLFRPEEEEDTNPPDDPDRKLVDLRAEKPEGLSSLFLTPATMNLLGLGDGVDEDGSYDPATDVQQFFATGLRYPVERAMVPRGLGYAQAGEPKKNLNDLIQQGGGAVDEIADWIKTNLPQFDGRKGGFPASQDYAKTLAANIIDYADADNDATVGADFRGVDSYPFVTQFFTQLIWVNHEGGNEQPYYDSGGTWHTKVQVNYHLQLWNPSDRPVDSGAITVDLSPAGNNRGENLALFFDGAEAMPLFPYPGNPTLAVDFGGAPLEPNGYRAVSFGPIEYVVDTGLSTEFARPSSSNGAGVARFRFGTSGKGVFEDSAEHGYRVLWNGVEVDRPGSVTHGSAEAFEKRAGRHFKSPSIGGEGPAWRGGQPGLRHANSGGVFAGQQALPLLGDPRGSYYVAQEISADRYDQNASWWGRHYIAPESTSGVKNWFVSEARLASWPDGGHHDPSDRAYSLAVVEPIGEGNEALRAKRTFVPANVPAEARVSQPDKAPARISNAGILRSITELGNIYDPIQWRPRWDAGAETTETVEKKWLELGRDPSRPQDMVADANYVVPSTLRIGRGEYAAFDRPGWRAWQLLDLFTLEDDVPTQGRVNINTASREVLRALGAGIALAADPRIEPPALRGNGNHFGPFQERQADLLADAIIQSRPFLTSAALSNAKITLNGQRQSFFGNPEVWPEGKRPARWLDAAAEEYFARLYGLVTVRSRNFRIFVTGDALDASGRVLSRSRWEYQIKVEPQRNGDGKVERQKVVVTGAKML